MSDGGRGRERERDLLFELLLRLYPESFRQTHGPEMRELFTEMKQSTRQGRARLYAGLVVDSLRGATRAWSRRAGWLGADLLRDVRHQSSSLRTTPGFAASGIVVIALGVGASTAVYSVVRSVLVAPLPYEAPDDLVMIFNQFPTLDIWRGAQTPGDLIDYREQTDAFVGFGSVSAYPQTLLRDETPRLVPVLVVTPGFFELLDFEPVLGRAFRDDDDDDRLLLSYGYWQTAFGGDPGVVGELVRFDRGTKEIVGVLPESVELVLPPRLGLPSSPGFFTPVPRGWYGRDGRDRSAHWMNVIARLAPGVSLVEAQGQLDAVARWQRDNVAERETRDARIELVPLHDEVVGESAPTLHALAAAVGLVLLIVCANVASLLLVRGESRQRELATRTALGASASRIVRQLLAEGVVLALVGSALGVVLATVGLRLLPLVQPDDVPRLDAARMDAGVLGFALASAVSAALLSSLLPALAVTRRAPGGGLARRSSGASSRSRLGRALIATEVALSIVLVVTSGLLLRSFAALRAVDTGYAAEGVLSFQAMPPQSVWRDESGPPPDVKPGLERYYQTLETAISELPGVVSVASIWPAPLAGEASTSPLALPGVSEAEASGGFAASYLVTRGAFETLGIPLLAGRDFQEGDDGGEVVIDRRLADELAPGAGSVTAALGRRLSVGWWSGPVEGEVIGVVENVRSLRLTEDNPPTLYRLGSVYAYNPMTFVVRTRGEPEALVETLRARVKALYPTVPLTEIAPLTDYADRARAPARFVLTLATLFAAAALVLASVGLFGVVSHVMGRRVRELAVRTAFGAHPSQLAALVLGQGARLVAPGLVLGFAGAWLAARALTGFLYDVAPGDPATYVAVVSVFAAVSATACYVPARRASRLDPVEVLRSE